MAHKSPDFSRQRAYLQMVRANMISFARSLHHPPSDVKMHAGTEGKGIRPDYRLVLGEEHRDFKCNGRDGDIHRQEAIVGWAYLDPEPFTYAEIDRMIQDYDAHRGAA